MKDWICKKCNFSNSGWRTECLKCFTKKDDKTRITEFNKDMTEEERNYYGEEFDEKR